MRILYRRLPAIIAWAVVLLVNTSCKKQDATEQTSGQETPARSQPIVVRIEGVKEPPELLIPSDSPITRTPQMEDFGKLIEGIKGGHEAAGLPAMNAFIAQHPNFGDAYPLRAALRCLTGDLQGAKADAEAALSGLPRVFDDNPQEDRNETLAMHAKLALIGHDDSTTSADLHKIISSYGDQFNYLTDGAVKVAHKITTPCAWSEGDVEDWLRRSHNAPESQVFRVVFATSFAQYDDDAKVMTQKYITETMRANPSSAPAYFYGAVGVKTIDGFKHFNFSDAEKAAYYNHLIELWSKVIQLDPSIEKAFAERAEDYLELKNYQAAISDYDSALALNPKHEALWNDRGLAKQETYDKSGAVADFTQDIVLERQNNDLHGMTYPLENRGDLYVKLGDYRHAVEDYTSLIAIRLHDIMPFINLDFIRELYPEYANVDDAKMKDKIHRMFVPNYTNENFERTISNPAGMSPTMDGGTRDTYLKRADVLLALKRFDAARRDYARAELFKERQEGDRWRTPPNFHGMALDVKTLETADQSHVKAWVKLAEDDKQPEEPQPTRFTLDCRTHTVQMGARPEFEPGPGTYAEAVSDFFCSAAH
jgi:tetratricopeptide (TPR) repeat protein